MFSLLGDRRSVPYKPVQEFHDDTDSIDTAELQETRLAYKANRTRVKYVVATKFSLVVILLTLGGIFGWFMRVEYENQLPPLIETEKKLQGHANNLEFAVIPKHLGAISVKRVFWNNETFDISRDDDESQAAWNSYFSRFISLEDNVVQDAELPPSSHANGRQTYSIAAYHQLHCVHVIRYAWGQLKAKGPPVLDEPYPGLESLAEGYTIEGHVSHCLNMIRQALECHADPTLEPMMKDDGVTLGGSLASGWGGTPHLCRDFSALTKWVDAPEQFPISSVEAFTDAFAKGHHHQHDVRRINDS